MFYGGGAEVGMNDEAHTFYLILGIMFLIFAWYAYRVEKSDNKFSWVDAFRDDNGKPAFGRILVAPTWLASTVVLFHEVGKADPDDITFFLYYLIFWSGATVALKALEVWGQRKGS